MEIAICKCSLTPESIMSLSDAPWGTGTARFRCAPIAYAQRAIRKRLDPDFEAYRQLIRELSRRGLWPKEGLPEKCPNFLRCADLKKDPFDTGSSRLRCCITLVHCQEANGREAVD